MTFDTNISKSKIDWRIINWMRGLAALYVVINHSRGMLFTDAMKYAEHVHAKAQWQWWEWLNIILMQHTNLGSEFVILFFILSGFSIAHSITRNNDIPSFYLRRFIRLYPPYLLGICWAVLVFLVIYIGGSAVFNSTTEGRDALNIPYHHFIEVKSLLANLFYIPTNNYLTPQYWSLPYEVIFYLIAPWIIKRVPWYIGGTIIAYIVGYALKGYFYLDEPGSHLLWQYLTDYNIYFLIGILIYIYRDRLLNSFRPGKWLSLAMLAVIFESLVISKSYLFHQESNKLTGIVMILFTYIILVSGLKYNIRVKWLERIGVFSYTLYVTHFASIFLMKLAFYKLGLHFYDIYIIYGWYLGIIVAVALAQLLYYVAEHPTINYIEKLRFRKNSIAA